MNKIRTELYKVKFTLTFYHIKTKYNIVLCLSFQTTSHLKTTVHTGAGTKTVSESVGCLTVFITRTFIDNLPLDDVARK